MLHPSLDSLAGCSTSYTFLHVVPDSLFQLLKLAWPLPVTAVLALQRPVRLSAKHHYLPTYPSCSCLSVVVYHLANKVSNLLGSLFHISQSEPRSPTIRHVQRIHTTS